MPIDKASLAAEIARDPKGMLAQLVASGQDNAVADELNLIDDSIQIPNPPLSSRQVVALVVYDEWIQLDADQREFFRLIVAAGDVDISDASPVRQLFNIKTTTGAALAAAYTRAGSLAEQLWGPDTVVTDVDVAHALRGK